MEYGHWNIDLVGNFDPENWYGFIYIIRNKISGRMYIGKKNFLSKKTRPPLKGQKRKRVSFLESDWKTYTSSSNILNEEIQQLNSSMFEFIIITLCSGKSELTFLEEQLQHSCNVLYAKDSNGNRVFYNNTIAHKNFAGVEKQSNESRQKISDSLKEFYVSNPKNEMAQETRDRISRKIRSLLVDGTIRFHNIGDWINQLTEEQRTENSRKAGLSEKSEEALETLRNCGRKSQKTHKENGTGFWGISEDDRLKNASNGGIIGGKMPWWNNGQICTRSNTCPGPDWVRGRIYKKKRENS